MPHRANKGGNGNATKAPAPPARRDHAHLKALLRERNQSPDRAGELDREILGTFQRPMAVLVLDMCGFSRLSVKYGIIYYLSMIAQMEELARPAVAKNDGATFKQEADNLFAVFPSAGQALEGALDIFLAFKSANSVLPSDRDIYGSIGIGFGDLIVAGDAHGVEDVFGSEMNLAARLGEDLAQGPEILLTPSAHAALPAKQYLTERAAYRHQDTDIDCFRYLGKPLVNAAAAGKPARAGASKRGG